MLYGRSFINMFNLIRNMTLQCSRITRWTPGFRVLVEEHIFILHSEVKRPEREAEYTTILKHSINITCEI
jgi:hypothetical protein